MKNKIVRLALIALISSGAFTMRLHGQLMLTNGLVAYYPFNGSIADSSGNHHDLSGAATFSTDRFSTSNSCVIFNTSSPLTTTNIPMTNSAGVSVSFWFDLTATPSIYGERMLMYGDWNNKSTAVISFCVWSDSHASVSLYNLSGIEIVGYLAKGMISMNNWCEITMTDDNTNMTLFFNGIKITNAVCSLPALNAPLYLGGDTGYYLKTGKLDAIRIYNRALSTNEVSQLNQYESGNPQLCGATVVLQLSTTNLTVGGSYQVQISTNLVTWQNYGVPFVANSTNAAQYVNMKSSDGFFRILAAP